MTQNFPATLNMGPSEILDYLKSQPENVNIDWDNLKDGDQIQLTQPTI